MPTLVSPGHKFSEAGMTQPEHVSSTLAPKEGQQHRPGCAADMAVGTGPVAITALHLAWAALISAQWLL